MDVLKIDKAFVHGLGRDLEDAAIVRAVVDLARAMDLRSIAEGVETAEQLSILRGMGCTLAQGYYLAKPLSSEEVGRLLAPTVLG